MQPSTLPASDSLSGLIFLGVVVALFAFLIFALRRARQRRRAEFAGPDKADERLEDGEAEPAAEIPNEAPPLKALPSQTLAKPRDEALRLGLSKTHDGLFARLGTLFGGKEIPSDLLQQVEEIMLTSDVGVKTTTKLTEDLKTRLSKQALGDLPTLLQALEDDIDAILKRTDKPLIIEKKPTIILMVGVNGVGKTTSIGKLATRFAAEGKSVMVAAGDTFRAAAADQLKIWSERSGATYFGGKPNQDPASVLFEACTQAKAQNIDIVLCDTAGRLHTKTGLMDELTKAKRVVGKVAEGAPHEVWLVVDATTGQNAVTQAREFHQAVGLTGIVLTKLDGTAKGGVVVAIAAEMEIPIRFVGVGETAADLRPFSPDAFAAALFAR